MCIYYFSSISNCNTIRQSPRNYSSLVDQNTCREDGFRTLCKFLQSIISVIQHLAADYLGRYQTKPVDRYNFVRDISAQYFIDHPSLIGGPGIEVEIDESKFGKQKYNRGRQVDSHWVFGGMERVSGECFLVEVQQRDANTLLSLIAQYICPDSIIYSDEWSSYNQLSASTGLRLLTVNHSLHFVDPKTGAHTQGVEAM